MSPTLPISFQAVVVDIVLESRTKGATLWRLAFDHTQFCPGDSGELEAVSASGARLKLSVLNVVQDQGGIIWHSVEKPLTEGTKITAIVTRRHGSLIHLES